MRGIQRSSSLTLFKPTKNTSIDIVLILLDYDGCLDQTFSGKNIVSTNILKHIKASYYNLFPSQVFIANGSLRQTTYIDQINAEFNENGSYFENFPLLVTYLQNENVLPIEISPLYL